MWSVLSYREQEKSRGYLVEALCRKGTALCRLRALAQSPAAQDKINDALANNLADLLKFADLSDTKVPSHATYCRLLPPTATYCHLSRPTTTYLHLLPPTTTYIVS